jgi:protein TonB
MFEDSLIESSGRLAQRNPWTTAISFAGQIAIAAIIALLSLIYTDALPTQKLVSMLQAPSPPAAAAPQAQVAARHAQQTSNFNADVLVPPREIPEHVSLLHDQGALPTSPAIGVPGGIVAYPGSPQLTEILRSASASLPSVAAPKVRLSSGVTQGMLIRQVRPHYPPLAREARIQGTVVLQALIGKDGRIENLHVLSGHPMLTQAAIEAVRQWLYRPYYLNNQAVEVDTEIRVNFTLATE